MLFVLFFWRPDRDRLDWEIWVAFCVIFLAAGPVQHAIGFGIPPACLVARGTGTRSPELLGDSQAPGGHFSEADLLGMPKLLGRPPCSWLWHLSSMLGVPPKALTSQVGSVTNKPILLMFVCFLRCVVSGLGCVGVHESSDHGPRIKSFGIPGWFCN